MNARSTEGLVKRSSLPQLMECTAGGAESCKRSSQGHTKEQPHVCTKRYLEAGRQVCGGVRQPMTTRLTD